MIQLYNVRALREDEGGCLHMDDQNITAGLKEGDLSVLVHIHGGRTPNLESFKGAMGRSWECRSFSKQYYDDQFYQVFYENKETVDLCCQMDLGTLKIIDLVLVRPHVRLM